VIPDLTPGELGIEVAAGLGTLLTRALAGAALPSYVESDPVPWSVFTEGGWDTIGVPEQAGGAGASLLDLAWTARMWGAHCLPSPLLVSTMVKRWSSAARELDGPVTLAVPRVHAGRAHGRTPFGNADGVVVARSLGLDHDALERLDAPAVDDFAPSLRLARTGWSTSVPAQARDELAVVWAAEATGTAEQMLELSVAYAINRQQFGRPVGSFQAVKHRLADMKLAAEAAETAALWSALEPGKSRASVSYALDTAVRIGEGAIQVHGGMGFTWELGLHYYVRHILMLRELVHGLWE
jgi:alkylation response protein AidB-like acyl-CoA dehydrogenase